MPKRGTELLSAEQQIIVQKLTRIDTVRILLIIIFYSFNISYIVNEVKKKEYIQIKCVIKTFKVMVIIIITVSNYNIVIKNM